MAIEFGSLEALAVLEADKELAYERRREVMGTVVCKCGAEVELESETEEWEKGEDGNWKHVSFGPGLGECEKCGRVYVETFEGVFMLTPKGDKRLNGGEIQGTGRRSDD